MRETVQLLRVVVASPADVAAERAIVETVAAELNRTMAADRQIRLEVVRWETDAYPGFHADGSQGICDEVLQIDKCDVLVGIFWTRFGKPTLSGMTGTEHEISRAVTYWQKNGSPHVMVFFNTAATNLRSAAERHQWAVVAEYREKFPKKGLFWEYDGASQFEEKFRNCMANYLRRKFPTIFSPENSCPVPNTVDGSAGSALSNRDWIKLFIDNRIPNAKIPGLLSAIADFVRKCGDVGIELKLTAESPKKGGTKNG